MRNLVYLILTVTLLTVYPGCLKAYKQSVNGDTMKVFGRIYRTDFNTAWQAVLDALKQNAHDVVNRDGGFIQTKWTDNTSEKNFTDSFGNADSYLKAQYRFIVNVAKGFYNGQQSVKVTVQKEQLIQRDVLEGWRPVETDSIDENTLLYRIERLIYIRHRLAQLDDEKAKEAIKGEGF
ncbi:MAG: hypothetical protein AABZ06_10710 [Bdellovibrionota bacterium]